MKSGPPRGWRRPRAIRFGVVEGRGAAVGCAPAAGSAKRAMPPSTNHRWHAPRCPLSLSMPLMQVIGDVMSATRMGPLHDPVVNPDPRPLPHAPAG